VDATQSGAPERGESSVSERLSVNGRKKRSGAEEGGQYGKGTVVRRPLRLAPGRLGEGGPLVTDAWNTTRAHPSSNSVACTHPTPTVRQHPAKPARLQKLEMLVGRIRYVVVPGSNFQGSTEEANGE
jgi:hypothetical protein